MTQINSWQRERLSAALDKTNRNLVPTASSVADTETDKCSEELRRRVQRFLGTRGIRGLEGVHVDVDGGVIVLRGRVASARDRWLCVSCSSRVAGVLRVIDELEFEEGVVDRIRTQEPKQPCGDGCPH